jgi:hypothetical protein
MLLNVKKKQKPQSVEAHTASTLKELVDAFSARWGRVTHI